MTALDRAPNRSRRTYHHGNLAAALTQAALVLAREGGPEAVVLREAARRVGVSPSAAYRHFPDRRDLLQSAKRRAHDVLADALDEALCASPAHSARDQAEKPLTQLRSLGIAYVRFALAERGLFRTAFCRLDPSPRYDPDGAHVHDAQRHALTFDQFRTFQLLSSAVDQLVEGNLLPASKAAAARITAWSAVHGLAVLMLDGPLAALASAQRDSTVCDVVDAVVRGLVTSALPTSSRPGP